MAVYKRAYSSYVGGLTPVWSRFWVLARYSFSELFDSRAFTALFVIAFFPTVITAIVIWVAHSETIMALLQMRGGPAIDFNNSFFLHFLEIQAVFTVLLTAWVGPTMVAGDLSNNALPLFLSRPLSRPEYVIGKMTVLLTLLSLITWIPGLLLFFLQASLQKGWLAANWWMAGSIVLASLLWISFLSLLSLAVSAWVKWRIVATAAVFASLMLPTGFGEMMNAVLRTYWGHLLNFWYMTDVVWYDLFRDSVRYHPGRFDGPMAVSNFPLPMAWLAILAFTGCWLMLLNRRLRAREVVRG
jgi:ABC-2 type transport system permease protein